MAWQNSVNLIKKKKISVPFPEFLSLFDTEILFTLRSSKKFSLSQNTLQYNKTKCLSKEQMSSLAKASVNITNLNF